MKANWLCLRVLSRAAPRDPIQITPGKRPPDFVANSCNQNSPSIAHRGGRSRQAVDRTIAILDHLPSTEFLSLDVHLAPPSEPPLGDAFLRRCPRGALYLMLQNRIYRGEITHKGIIYPGPGLASRLLRLPSLAPDRRTRPSSTARRTSA